jgi:hypothetical protein
MGTSDHSTPDFWRMCFTDAYLFKLAYVYTPLLSLLLLYNAANSRPWEDFILPGILLAAFLGAIFLRHNMIRSALASTVELKSRIDIYSSPGGFLNIHITAGYCVEWNGEESEQTACLVKFNPQVKKLREGSLITVLWNPDKKTGVIKEAYIDN